MYINKRLPSLVPFSDFQTLSIWLLLLYIPGGGGVLPYMSYIGICGAKGYGFSAALVINRVLILAILPSFW